PEPHEQLLRILQERALEETQREVFLEALKNDDVLTVQGVRGLAPLTRLLHSKPGEQPLHRRDLRFPACPVGHLHGASPSSADVDARPAGRLGFGLTQYLATDRRRVALAEREEPQQVRDWIAFGPAEVGVRQRAGPVAQIEQ